MAFHHNHPMSYEVSEIRSLITHEKTIASIVEAEMYSIRADVRELKKKGEKAKTIKEIEDFKESLTKLQRRIRLENDRVAKYRPSHRVSSLLSQLRSHDDSSMVFSLEEEIYSLEHRYSAFKNELLNIQEQLGLLISTLK